MPREGPTLDEFKAQLPLADIVARHVKLTRRGREYVGLCPFHQEKTPSFSVVEDKGFYHCFGCGAHGNAIDFVMAIERLEFGAALQRLADLTGIPAPLGRLATAGSRVDPSLYDVLAAATAWFEQRLIAPDGAAARHYLARRGLDAGIITTFRLGYAPAERDALKRALSARGIGEDRLLAAGLVVRPDDGRATYDRFRERVMFPITDSRSRIVGFGARAMGDAKPKYLNSPETELFDKGRLLYNQAAALRPAREQGTIIVVEGYMDVIALCRAGLSHSVAPLGTAITDDQLRALWRLADEPILCLDGDAAGYRAAFRAAERALPLLQPGRSLRFVLLPQGEDPDSVVAARGAAGITEPLASPMPLVEFLWRHETRGGMPDTPERRAGLEQRLRELASRVGRTDLRSHYVAAFRERLAAAGLSSFRTGPGSFRRRLDRGRSDVRRALAGPSLGVRTASPERERTRRLLRAVLRRPQLLTECEEELVAAADSDPQAQEICGEILAWYAQTADLDAAGLLSHLSEHGFAPLVEQILERRPWVRGALADGVDSVATATLPSGQGEAGVDECDAVGPAISEDGADERFGTLYRILQTRRGAAAHEAEQDDAEGGSRCCDR